MLFRAHRGVIKNRALLHKEHFHAEIKAHAKRGMKPQKPKLVKPAKPVLKKPPKPKKLPGVP